jgi:hypothetical protein
MKYILVDFNKKRQVAYLKNVTGGMCIAKSYQCYIIGVYKNEGLQHKNSGNCNVLVEKFAEKLKLFNF